MESAAPEDRDLPSRAEIVAEFGLFLSGGGCAPELRAGGELKCVCDGCRRWADFVAGIILCYIILYSHVVSYYITFFK